MTRGCGELAFGAALRVLVCAVASMVVIGFGSGYARSPDAGQPSQYATLTEATEPIMISIPATTFWMGDPWGEGMDSERPFHSVSLSPYQIGKYEVTNAEFVEFLNDMLAEGRLEHTTQAPEGTVNSYTGWWKPRTRFILFQDYSDNVYSQIEFQPETSSFAVRVRNRFPMAGHPAVCASWWGAAAYCNWLSRKMELEECYTESRTWPCDFSKNGYHLPTEPQWECAAAWDPTRNHAIARGHWRYGYQDDAFSFSRTNSTDYAGGGGIVSNNPLALAEQPFTAPVGFFNGINVGRNGPTQDSRSYYGCYDVTGNVWDWCNDWYDAKYYSYSLPKDPPGPSGESVQLYGTGAKVCRGGSWYCYPFQSRTSFRWTWQPWATYHFNGFRLARQEPTNQPEDNPLSIRGEDVQVGWKTQSGLTYQLQYCEDLALPDWLNLGTPVTGTGGWVNRPDSGAASLRWRFYRIQSQP